METRLEFLPTAPFPRDPFVLSPIAGGAGPQLNNLDEEDEYHPFKVYVMSLEAQGSQAQGKWGVEYKSVVYKDKNDFSNQPIIGLLTNRLSFDDPGWNAFPTDQDKIVYLKGTVSGGQVTAIDVDDDLTLTQLNTKNRITGSGSSQTEFICPIARLFRYGSNPQRLGVEQYVKTNLMLQKVSFGDDEGWYPCPGPAGGGGGGVSSGPWDVSLSGVGTPDSQGKFSSYNAIVNPGTINNILPSNTFASDGGFVKFTIQANVMTYLFLDVATDGKKINTAELKTATNLPTDAPPVATNMAPSKIVIPLGIVKNLAAVKLRSSAITATPVVAGTISKVPQNPNDEPFTRTWMWKVESK